MSASLDPVPDEKGEFLGESFDGRPVHILRTSGNTALKESVKPNPLFIPIRFQGQYEDVETGLFYNRFRYYEPTVGQYLSADPIGFAGGTNSWSYVQQTNMYVDRFGLCCLEAGKNLKQHYIDHKHILEQCLNKKYPRWKDSNNASEFLQDLGALAGGSNLPSVDSTTINKGSPVMDIYQNDCMMLVVKPLPNGGKEFVTLLEPGKGMAASIANALGI